MGLRIAYFLPCKSGMFVHIDDDTAQCSIRATSSPHCSNPEISHFVPIIAMVHSPCDIVEARIFIALWSKSARFVGVVFYRCSAGHLQDQGKARTPRPYLARAQAEASYLQHHSPQ